MPDPSSEPENPYRRGRVLLLGTLVAYALLVALHLGEFWPFSIYPMFSSAGQPWSRAVVRALPPDTDAVPWDTLSTDELPGTSYGLAPRGVDAIDLANYVSKTRVWNAPARAGLHRLFADQLDEQHLVVFRAQGRLDAQGRADIRFVPYAFLRADTTLMNPSLPREVAP